MEINTKRLILNPISMNELNDVFKYFTKEVTKFMLPKPAEHIDESKAFILSTMTKYDNKEEIVFAVRLKETNEFIGCMGLHHMNTRTPELGIWLKIDAHGNHYGLEGMKAIYEYAKMHLDYDYIIYPVDRKNISSRNIPESLGGIVEKAYDVINQEGNTLNIIEYFIYKDDPTHVKYPTLLFQGDSITDCNRNRGSIYDLGHGYVNKLLKHINHAVILNRGISGNRTVELLERWNIDTLAIQPDLLSILVGINEIWHHYKHGKIMTVQKFEENYIQLLEQVKKQLPNTKILMIEPFVFPIGEYEPTWEKDLREEQQVVKRLAEKYADYYIPMQSILDEKLSIYTMDEICGDGVHPSDLGHEIIAKEIAKRVKEFMIDFQLNNK